MLKTWLDFSSVDSLFALITTLIYSDISQNSGYVNWLDWRLGADFDVVNSYGVRLGVTCDYYPERPA